MKAADKKTTEGETIEPPGLGGLPPRSANDLSVRARLWARPVPVSAAVIILAGSAMLAFLGSTSIGSSGRRHSAASSDSQLVIPAAAPASVEKSVKLQEGQLRHVELEPVGLKPFHVEKSAPGKIAFNEDTMTPIFSCYSGRIVRLFAKPGDLVEPGSPLLEIDTPDLIQAESELLSATSTLAKAKTALNLAQRSESRFHDLYVHKAVALKDWEQAQSGWQNAEYDVHAAQAVLKATRGRLRVLGKNEAEIARLESGQEIDRVARVVSPLAGRYQ